jgi:hypothetical protein
MLSRDISRRSECGKTGIWIVSWQASDHFGELSGIMHGGDWIGILAAGEVVQRESNTQGRARFHVSGEKRLFNSIITLNLLLKKIHKFEYSGLDFIEKMFKVLI